MKKNLKLSQLTRLRCVNGKKKILLVEGVNDAHVILALLGANEISAKFRNYPTKIKGYEESNAIEIREKGGIEEVKKFDKLLESLETEIKANQDFLGIVVDADTNIDTRWLSIVNRLKKAGYLGVSEKPIEEGLILESVDFLPKVGIWIMPNNKLLGKIEDFIRLLVAQEKEPLWKIAEKSVTQIPKEHKLFAEKDLIKAQIHTFLAWQDEPGRPMGESITRRYFQPKAPEAQNFVNWLKLLFVE